MAASHYPPNWVFHTPVADLASPAGAVLPADAKLEDIARALVGAAGTAAVCRPDGVLAGLVDARLVMGWLLKGFGSADRPPLPAGPALEVVRADETAFSVLTRMIAEDRGVLAVAGRDGRFRGIVTREAILARIAGPVWNVARAAAELDDNAASGPLMAMRDCQTALAARMLEDEIPAESILAMITEINNEVHRRVVVASVAALQADGWGAPPCAYSFLVMGSSGRGENFLDPDQDNALVFADTEDATRPAVESYFIALSDRITTALAAAGFPHCKGNMMATSPVWRKSASEWRLQIRSWVRRKDPVQLMNCDTLLDFVHVSGTADLAAELRRQLLDMVRREPGFLRALYSIEEDHGVALDWLGRLAREKDEFGPTAETNLKLRGLLPLIEGARLAAVSAGLSETSTVARLRGVGATGAIDSETAEGLVEAYRIITARLLRHQIALRDATTGSPIRIPHGDLSRADKSALRDALRRISRYRAQLPALLERSVPVPVG